MNKKYGNYEWLKIQYKWEIVLPTPYDMRSMYAWKSLEILRGARFKKKIDVREKNYCNGYLNIPN